MKKWIVVLIGAGVALGAGYYLNRAKPENVLTPANSSTPAAVEQIQARPNDAAEATQPVVKKREEPSQPPASQPVAKAAPAATAVVANPNLDAAFLSQAVDLLVSTQATRQQKRAAWKQLRDAGKLDPVIAELEQRTANDPRAAEYPAALGQAYLQKCGTIKDMREQAVLAMQADKLFDTALTLDPANWEARFTKAVGMSYWPSTLNKGDEVIQHFQTLIEQQEAQTPQPHFAETYAWLGDQYQKSGRTDDARAVWQRGAALFPADEKLREKLSSAQ